MSTTSNLEAPRVTNESFSHSFLLKIKNAKTHQELRELKDNFFNALVTTTTISSSEQPELSKTTTTTTKTKFPPNLTIEKVEQIQVENPAKISEPTNNPNNSTLPQEGA